MTPARTALAPGPPPTIEVTASALPSPPWESVPALNVVSSTPAPLPLEGSGPTLEPFEFTTVTVDSRGAVTDRRKGLAREFTENLDGVSLEMVEISGGTFVMGSPKKERGRFFDEDTHHEVSVSPFYVGKFEVTQAQWRVVASWPSVATELSADPSFFQGEDLPVEKVSWDDAVEFCARLAKRTGRVYRLPTEAEWEYACRAGTTTPFAFGPTISPKIVNYDSKRPYGSAPKGEYRGKTVEVGSLGYANAFGLYDMHGNVWEWCQDIWHNSYYGAPTNGLAWSVGGEAGYHVVRGGSWDSYGNLCRSAHRDGHYHNSIEPDFGFRVVCEARTL